MFGYRELSMKYRFVIVPVLAAASLMTLQSYLRFAFTGTLTVDQVFPDAVQSTVLFVLFMSALILAGLGWYNGTARADECGLSRGEVTRLALAAAAIGALSLPYLSNDIFIYLACGDLARKGFNPYTDWHMLAATALDGHLSPIWRDQPFCKYGPLSTAVFHFSALAAPGGVVAMLFLYKAVLFAAVAGFIHVARRFSETIEKQEGIDPFPFIALSPLLWLQGMGQGHNDLFAALPLLLGALLLRSDRPVAASALFAAAAAVKAYAAVAFLLVLVYLYRKGKNALFSVASTALRALFVVLAVTVVLYFPYWNGLATVTVPYGALAAEMPLNNTVFLAGFLYAKIFPSSSLPIGEVFALMRSAALPFIFLLVLYQLRAMFLHGERMIFLFGRLLIVLFCFFVARFHPWYLLVAIPFIAERLDRRWLVWSVAVMTAANLLDIHNFMSRDAIALSVALPAAVVFVNIMFFSRFRDRYLTA